MRETRHTTSDSVQLRRYVLALAAAWTVVVGALLIGSILPERHDATALAPSYGAVWLVGMVVFVLGGRRFKRRVDERDRATAALAASEERYRQLFEHNVAGVFRSTVEGELLDCNESLLRILGYESREELVSRSAYDLYMSPADRERWLARLKEHGVLSNQELWLRCKNGRPVWVLENANLINDETGLPRIIQGIVIDITQRRQARDLVEIQRDLGIAASSTSSLADVLDRLLEASFRLEGIDCGGVYLVNGITGALDLVSHKGLSPEFVDRVCHYGARAPQTRLVMAGQPVYGRYADIVPADDVYLDEGLLGLAVIPVCYEGQVVAVVNLGSHAHEEIPIGVRRALEAIAAQVGGVIARIKAEEAIVRAKEEWERTFDAVPDLIALLDDQYRIMRANKAMADRLGLTPEECAGQTCYACIHGTDESLATCPHAQLLKDSREHTAEIHEPRLGGDFLVTTSPLRDAEGRTIGSVHIARDITQRRQLEEQLRQAQKMEAIGTLAGGIAHDFNNLVTAIQGYAALAKTSLPTKHAAAESLELVEQAARQASGVTHSLLTFCRRGAARKSPYDLRAVLAETIHLLGTALPAAVDLVEDLGTDRPWVNGDPNQLQQVLMNLAVNARDAMPNGGQLRIALRHESNGGAEAMPSGATPTGRAAVITVEDTGTGMTEPVRARIFEPFFTTKPREHGTGLGLSLVHGIVTDHGGSVNVDSEPGRGTRVTVRLPCCEPAEPTEKAPDREEPRTGRGDRILLVASDEQIRSITASTLRVDGYRVIQAADANEAISALDQHQAVVRLVVLDMELPDEGGSRCLRKIRQNYPDLPVLAVSGGADTDPLDQLAEQDHLLRKPYQMGELAASVRAILAKAEAGLGAET